jgi:predicted CoA-binding protein
MHGLSLIHQKEINSMTVKMTMVLGVSLKPERFSNRAVKKLVSLHYPVIAVGLREGEINGVRVQKPFPRIDEIHTITLYLGAKTQAYYYRYILKLSPKRVIFNPGAENEKFEKMLINRGVEVVRDCTLMMLSHGTY